MTEIIHIRKKSELRGKVLSLPSSKSLSNRALVINALTQNKGTLSNLSTARDTQRMQELLTSADHVVNVLDAGTTMRFLTAFYALTGQRRRMTGSDRMLERPIGPLVSALSELGANVEYAGKQGYPPLELQGFSRKPVREITMRGDVSSQFVSAIMMAAVALRDGLTIRLEGKVGSRPYLEMTAGLMEVFGVKTLIGKDTIEVPAGGYTPATYRVEPDWSAASYWFAFTALAQEAEILLPGVSPHALQGDKVIIEIMKPLGVQAEFAKDGLKLTKTKTVGKDFSWDFSDCPDLAQTVIPVCAAKKISGHFSGLDSLRVKETDRISALQTELTKIGATLTQKGKDWELQIREAKISKPIIQTYHDHRMAMGFAPLGAVMDLSIEDPTVVNKSYPGFWDDLKEIGFTLQSEAS